jgi:hypothetical protein
MSSLPVRLSLSLAVSIAWLAACGAGAPPLTVPDAAPVSTVPASPSGVFAVTSTLDVAAPPTAAAIVAELAAATDGADDPARYLLDRMIAALPQGTVQTIARDAAPYLAAYLRERLDGFAPRLVPGLEAIAARLLRIAGHLATIETLQIDDRGGAVRTITGVRFDVGAAPVTANLADAGLPDLAMGLRVTLDGAGHLTLGEHAHRWPHGAILRLGLDRAVIASVVPAASDLTGALTALVDCPRLGALVADALGTGTAAPYRVACRAGMIAIASEIYAEIAAIDDTVIDLEVSGAATGLDLDGDGTLDEIRTGSWSGTLSQASLLVPIEAASFTGRKVALPRALGEP